MTHREMREFLDWCAEKNVALVKVDALNVAPPAEVSYLLPNEVRSLCQEFNKRPIQGYKQG